MMRQRWFLTAVVITTLTAADESQAANLLNNPGFEEPLGFDFSDPTNWNGFFGGPEGTVLEAFNDTGATAFDGERALELTIEAGTFEGQPVNGTNAFTGHVQNILIAADDDPCGAGMWGRSNGGGGTGDTEFRLEFRNGDQEISRVQIEISDLLTDEYQLFEINTIVPKGTTNVNVVVAVSSFNQDVPHDHSVLFDNAYFTIVPEPTAAALAAIAAGSLVMRRRR